MTHTSTRTPPPRCHKAFWLGVALLTAWGPLSVRASERFLMLPLAEGVGLATENTWLGYVLSDSVNQRLPLICDIERVPEPEADAATERLGKPFRLVRSSAEALVIGADLECAYVAWGALHVDGPEVVVDVEVLDVAAGASTLQQSLRCRLDAPGELADQLLARAAVGLGQGGDVRPPRGEEWDSHAFLASYGDALALMDDARGAHGRDMTELAGLRLAECVDALATAIEAAPSAGGAYRALQRACTWALELDPSCAQAWANLALVHEHDGDLGLAVSELWNSVRAAPADARLRARLGCALVGYALTQAPAVRGATLEQAQDALRSSIAIDAHDYLSQYGMGLAHYYRGRFAQAVDSLVMACDLAVNLPEPWYALGLALRESGRQAEAEAALSQALERSGGEFSTQIRATLKELRVQ